MLWIFALLAVMAGSLLPFQAGFNASLRHFLGNPVLAAVTNFTVGWTLLVGYALASRAELPTLAAMGKAPWWIWTGGAMGATLVLSGVMLSHRLGAAAFMSCIILGQLSASVVADHFGLAGFAQHAVSPMRLAGIGLLLAGAYLIRTH